MSVGAPLLPTPDARDLRSYVAPVEDPAEDGEFRYETFHEGIAEGVDRLYLASFSDARDPAAFRWKFYRAPGGVARASVAVHKASGQVVASTAGRMRRFWIAGRELTAAQTFEAATHPEFRRLRLFRAVMGGFAMQIGRAGGVVALGGKMGEAAFRVGQRVFGFRTMLELHTWELRLSYRAALRRRAGALAAPLTALGDGLLHLMQPDQRSPVHFERVEQFGAEVDELWLRVRHRYPLCFVRDARWLNYRYRDCPFGRHRIWLARRHGRLEGYLVVRLWEREGVQLATVLDWLDGQDLGLLREMLVRAAADAGAAGADFFHVAGPRGGAVERAVSALPGFHRSEREELDRVAGNLMDFPGLDEREHAFLADIFDEGRWHYTQGDSDFHD